jgi:hypothetical protein
LRSPDEAVVAGPAAAGSVFRRVNVANRAVQIRELPAGETHRAHEAMGALRTTSRSHAYARQPVVNVDEPVFDEPREQPGLRCTRARLSRQAGSSQAGSERLGLSLWELPPGEAACPCPPRLCPVVVLSFRDVVQLD